MARGASKLRMTMNDGRSGRRDFVGACLGAAAAVGVFGAQEPAVSASGGSGTSTSTTIRTDVKVVNVYATVHDKKGQIVKTLTQEDFSIDEDGRSQTIKYFSHENDLELTLGLLIDTSGSQRRVIGEERSASYRFLDQVLREEKDIAFVIRFDHEVELVVDLTSSRKQLEKGIYNLQVAVPGQRGPEQGGAQPRRRGGGTELYDAVMLASEEVMAKQRGRKAIVVMSDGEDRGSKVSLFTAINAAQKADTLVYSILFADDEQPYYPTYGMGGRRRGGGMPPPRQSGPDGDGKKVLERLAKETGGSFFSVSHRMPLSAIFERMQEELRNQYSIGYTPDQPAKAGEFRKIHLATRDKTLVVQSRDGYYGSN